MPLNRFAVVVLLTVSLLAGCNNPMTFSDKYDRAEMDQAIARARAEFDAFLARARKPQPGDSAFSVKVRLTDSNGTEHLWVSDLQLDSEPFRGKLSADAEILRNVSAGYTVIFTRDQVTDWMYNANGKVEGNYTLRVLLKTMPKEEAAALRARLGWE